MNASARADTKEGRAFLSSHCKVVAEQHREGLKQHRITLLKNLIKAHTSEVGVRELRHE